MTNYRMVFVPSATHLATIAAYNPSVYSWLNVPLACIDRVEKERKPRESRSTGITILITCKDCRVHRLTVQSTGNNSTSDYEIEKGKHFLGRTHTNNTPHTNNNANISLFGDVRICVPKPQHEVSLRI